MIDVSVIVCTRNPAPDRFEATLRGLAAQSFPVDSWELVIVDNGSSPPLRKSQLPIKLPQVEICQEAVPGLTPARVRGITQASGEILVFVDDDNILAPNYLQETTRQFSDNPSWVAAGGKIEPRFEVSPPDWTGEFFGLLAIKDHGDKPLVAPGGEMAPWPDFAPVGAGLCIRKSAARNYVDRIRHDPWRATLDRRAGELTSGGDNDIVFTALRAGGQVAYLPSLVLTHLIPASRLSPAYLGRLNRGIQRSWVKVLALHGACSWSPVPRWSVPLRKLRAWFTYRAWSTPAARIRWAGACGHFEGRADIA